METPGTSPESAAKFRMIDIGEKTDTQRRAVASGEFTAQSSTLARIRERTLPKGDVLMLAEVAGIQGAKKTSDLLPLCHPLSLTSVRVWFEFDTACIRVYCEAKTFGKTGVEMEALAGVSAALLCVYDLTKGIDPVLGIGNIRLDLKEGGKSGHWKNPGIATPLTDAAPVDPKMLQGYTVSVLTLSDRCSRHEAKDESGPEIARWFRSHGAQVLSEKILPDDRTLLSGALHSLLKENAPNFVITTGGTGLSSRDVTPETIEEVAREYGGREIPGIGELLRSAGSLKTEHAWLSRSAAYLVSQTLIVSLPGSVKAVKESLESVGGLLKHAVHTAHGGKHEK